MIEDNPYPQVFPFFFLFLFYLETPSFMVIKLLVAQKNMTPPKNIFKNCVLGKAKLGLFLNTKAFYVLVKEPSYS
jgi:hypothetical protein